jgi:hypothetical protein
MSQAVGEAVAKATVAATEAAKAEKAKNNCKLLWKGQ